MTILYARAALNDIEAITEYIAQDNPTAADGVKDRIFREIDQLVGQLGAGRVGRVGGTRELVIPPYIVAYQVKGDAIEIIAVIDGRRGNITSIIGGRL